MKNLVLTIGFALISMILLSNKAYSQNICDSEGNLLISKTELLNAYNSLAATDYQAVRIGLSGNSSGSTHSILFHLENGTAIAYEIGVAGNGNYQLNLISGSKTHKCTGAPCNACEMSSTWFTAVTCTCNQNDCTECKCNHSVSETIGAYAPSPNDLNKKLKN